jgi:glycosyltransferase involved in cell wall biosynthesis
VRSQQFDVCHVQTPNYLTDAWALGRLRRMVPVVLLVHDVVPHEERLPGWLERRILRRVYRSADVYLVLHETVGDRLVEEFGVPRRSLVVAHLAIEPVDTARPPALDAVDAGPDSPVHFLFFGTLRHDKGLPVLVEAARLLADDAAVRIHVAGGGDRELEQIVAGAAERSLITADIGRITAERKDELFRSADVIVLPYSQPERFQSQSAVLGDAYAYGRPLVVTDVGALGATVRTDETGWIVPPADPGELADALRAAARDDDGRRAATAAVARARGAYSYDDFGRTLRKAYVAALQLRGLATRDGEEAGAPLWSSGTGPRDPADITFTVVIPTIGGAEVANAVAAVLAQRHVRSQVVVVGDGIDDFSVTLEARDDDRIHVLPIEHSGPGGARNAGARVATGEWIVFLDDDDRVDSEWLSTLAVLAARPRAGMVRCAAQIVDRTRGQTKRPVTVDSHRGLAGTFAVRRELFEAVGGYDAVLRFGENTELCLRLSDACRARGLAELRTDRVLVTVQRHDPTVYPPEVLLASARRVLMCDAQLLEQVPVYHSNLWGIAGVNAARVGDTAAARRYLLRAAVANPRRARSWARAAMALMPGVARRRWAASNDQ